MNVQSYRFSVLSYQIIGAVCGLFFAGCALGAFMAKQYPPIAIFAMFIAMGIYMVVAAGRYEISAQAITHQNPFGKFRIAWSEVLRVEVGSQGSVVLHGENKRFALAPPASWSGRQKPEAYELFQKRIEEIGAIVYPSNTADYKTHKNVRVPRSDA
ncbi:MAG: hypothetical protein KF892_23600 [Rhizobacter sp.]|nr:hypothetical protein [Rhizobacter sp.]